MAAWKLTDGSMADELTFHHWRREHYIPKFLQAAVIQCFYGVMALRSHVEAMKSTNVIFPPWMKDCHTLSFLQASCTQFSSEVMARWWVADATLMDSVTFPPWRKGRSMSRWLLEAFKTLLLRSDGTAVACGDNSSGEFEIPALDEGISYIQVSAGTYHSVLLRSDGHAVACGSNTEGQCNIPPLDKGLRYTQVVRRSVAYSAPPKWWSCCSVWFEWSRTVRYSQSRTWHFLRWWYSTLRRPCFTVGFGWWRWCLDIDFFHLGRGRKNPLAGKSIWWGLGDSQETCVRTGGEPPKSSTGLAWWAIAGQLLSGTSRSHTCRCKKNKPHNLSSAFHTPPSRTWDGDLPK